MRYMMLACHEPAEEPSPEEIAAMPAMVAWKQDLEERGVSHHAVRLRPAAEAVTVRVRGGQRLVTDGPFAETKEQIGGYEVMECADLDEAIEVAGLHPSAVHGSLEIRPFWED